MVPAFRVAGGDVDTEVYEVYPLYLPQFMLTLIPVVPIDFFRIGATGIPFFCFNKTFNKTSLDNRTVE